MIPGVPGESQVFLNGEFLRVDEAKISVPVSYTHLTLPTSDLV